MKMDARSEELSRTESVAERADAYRVALTLTRGINWAEGLFPNDVLKLAMFLTEGLDGATTDYAEVHEYEGSDEAE